MKKLILSLILLTCLPAMAADRITAVITATNNTETGDTFTVNGDIRTWTNLTSVATISTNALGTAAGVSTNLFNAIAAFQFTSPYLDLAQTNATTLRLIAPLGQPLVVVATGAWATVTFTTQSTAQATYTAIWPFAGIPLASHRTNQASEFVVGMGLATNSFATNATAFENYLNTGPGHQALTAGKIIYNGIVSNVTVHAVGGTLTNIIGQSITITNLFAPGTAGGVEIGGATAANATGTSAISIGDSSLASGTAAVGIGSSASGANEFATGLGFSANAAGTNSTAVGISAQATLQSGTSIGDSASANSIYGTAIGAKTSVALNHTNSTALGAFAATTKTNQVVLGNSTNTVFIPGRLVTTTATNTTLTGATTNSGTYSTPVVTIATLANGANTIGHSNAVYLRLTGTLTGSTNSIVGITAGRNGQVLNTENTTGQTITIAHQSGLEVTAGNRIVVPGGEDVTLQDDGTFRVIYDSTQSRWILNDVYPQIEVTPTAVYGSIRHSNTTEVLALTTTPIAVTNQSNIGLTNGVTVDLATGGLTLDTAGVYEVGGGSSFSGAGGGQTYDLEIYKGAVPTGIRAQRKASSTDVGNSTIVPGYVQASVGDIIYLFMSDTGGSSSITILESGVYARKISN